jgi:polysaccharide pyruvyl transferase CsaB
MRILISGYYGYGNVGDEAVLYSIINGIKGRLPDTNITVLSSSPESTRATYKVDAINRYSLFDILKHLFGCDIFISGGGSLFQDKTSSRSFIYYICLVWLAKALGKKVMVFAQGLGPLKKSFNRNLAKSILNKADLITLRDNDSVSGARFLGVKEPNIVSTADPSFCLDFSSPVKDKKLLGIVLRPLSRKQNYQVLAKTVDWLVNTYKYVPVFIPFHKEKDQSVARIIAKYMSEKLEIHDPLENPVEMLAYISKLELMIGMRLHSLIFAAICNVPMLGLSYDPKVESFMKQTRYPCLNAEDLLDLKDLKNSVEYILEKNNEIKDDLNKKKKALFDKANLNFELLFKLLGKSWK